MRWILLFSLVTLFGCGQQQKIVNATAYAAIAADGACTVAFDVAADVVADEVEEDGLEGQAAFDAWCERIAPAWEVITSAECVATALANLALTGQRLIDTDAMDDASWMDWIVASTPVVAALVTAWAAIDPDHDPPQELLTIATLLGAMSGGELPEECKHIPPQPPGCPLGGDL
jgi:uncharacterized membrane protein YhaH (DUF805 family)